MKESLNSFPLSIQQDLELGPQLHGNDQNMEQWAELNTLHSVSMTWLATWQGLRRETFRRLRWTTADSFSGSVATPDPKGVQWENSFHDTHKVFWITNGSSSPWMKTHAQNQRLRIHLWVKGTGSELNEPHYRFQDEVPGNNNRRSFIIISGVIQITTLR